MVDAESMHALRIVSERWRERAAEWEGMAKERLAEEAPKLKGDLEMLDRHIEGIQEVKNALDTFRGIKQSLDALYNGVEGDDERRIRSINDELRMSLHVDYGFEMHYLRKRYDYRCPPEAFPLPHGFLCHKKYQDDIEGLKAEMQALLNGANQALEGQPAAEEARPIDQVNEKMDRYHELQSKLYYLLQSMEPLNAEAFHRRCGELITEKMRLLERLRLSQIAAL
jgi:hypothetical protein